MNNHTELKSWSISNGVNAFEAMSSLRKLQSIKVKKNGMTHTFSMETFEKWFDGLNDELLEDLINKNSIESCLSFDSFWMDLIDSK
jgi:adenine C2-methylase RlmN of 23S rRNA A2503 and tRNA A37